MGSCPYKCYDPIMITRQGLQSLFVVSLTFGLSGIFAGYIAGGELVFYGGVVLTGIGLVLLGKFLKVWVKKSDQ
jgi:hypothetical protein